MGGGTGAKKNLLHNIVSIDTKTNLMAFGIEGGHIQVEDCILYGDHNMPNLNCPDADNCALCRSTIGIIIPNFGNHLTGAKKPLDDTLP